MVEAEEIQQRSVKIVDVDLVGDGSAAVVVGGAPRQQALSPKRAVPVEVLKKTPDRIR